MLLPPSSPKDRSLLHPRIQPRHLYSWKGEDFSGNSRFRMERRKSSKPGIWITVRKTIVIDFPTTGEPKEYVPLEKLLELGVISWRLNGDGGDPETDEDLKKIREARGYTYMDSIDLNPYIRCSFVCLTNMKILQANAGALTDFEVLDFFRSRGVTSDPSGCIGLAEKSECVVFKYLSDSAACTQTKEEINEFLKRCEKFKLAKAEKLNIINVRPSNLAEIDPVIESIDERFPRDEAEGISSEVQELVNLVVEVLPPPPNSKEEASSEEVAAAPMNDCERNFDLNDIFLQETTEEH